MGGWGEKCIQFRHITKRVNTRKANLGRENNALVLIMLSLRDLWGIQMFMSHRQLNI